MNYVANDSFVTSRFNDGLFNCKKIGSFGASELAVWQGLLLVAPYSVENHSLAFGGFSIGLFDSYPR